MLGPLGPGSVAQMKSVVSLAEDLLAGVDPAGDDLLAYTNAAELSGNAALAFQDAAAHTPGLAVVAREQAITALANRPAGFSRSQVFDQISVTAAEFTGIDPDQAAVDGHVALDLAARVATSQRVTDRLRLLLGHSAPHAERPAVAGFRERLVAELAVA